MVEVTQADREAAATVYKCTASCEHPEDGFIRAENARLGNMDDLPTVQAFARHRIAAFNAGLEAAETLRLRQVLTEWDEGFEAALNAVRNLKIGEE